MGVSEEYKPSLGMRKLENRVEGIDEVLIFVEHRAVDHQEPVDLARPRGKLPQVRRVIRRERLHGPLRGAPGDRVEADGVLQPAAGLIVVAANHFGDIGAYPFGDGIGIGPIPDDIAKTNNPIVAVCRRSQNRLEGFPVAVYVAKDEVTHGVRPGPAQARLSRTRVTSGRAPTRMGKLTVPMPRLTYKAEFLRRYSPAT